MSYYPDRHHPVFFLEDALRDLGVRVEFTSRDERTEGCWGLIVNERAVIWLIDNRWMHERAHEDSAAKWLMARGALVCCAQKPDAERIGAKWLPLAVTPGYYLRHSHAPKVYDVGFVGYIHDGDRLVMLKHLSRKFNLVNASGIFGTDAAKIYQDSRIGVNIPTRYGDPLAYDSANMRCFEVLATGTPLVTPHEDYLEELGLRHGENCYTFTDVRSLEDCIEDALADPQQAAQIGLNGAALAVNRHLYTHRALQVMEWLK